MSESKKVLPTPMHLLHALSLVALTHLERVCTKALGEAEAIADKLDKECERAQKKLLKSRLHLQDAAFDGKTGVQTRSRKRIEELEEKIISLKKRRAHALQYLANLKRDREESLILAEGVRAVREATGKALSMRQSERASPSVTAAAGKSAANRTRKQPQTR
jgi:hypothetical protein